MLPGLTPKLTYAINEIRKNGNNLQWWRNRFHSRLNSPAHQRFTSEGIEIMDEDWDTLLIADACRLDIFTETVDTDRFDDFGSRRSKGSSTAEWSKKNFKGKYGDTIYVAGNPVPSRHISGQFFRYVEVWRDAFDPEIGTIRAEDVAEEALKQHEEHPNKRLIVHMMQPHYPFVRDLDIDFSYWKNTDGISFGDDNRARDVWDALSKGLISYERTWEAYRRNLKYVMGSIDHLLEELDGRTVVTSDHGNATEERSWPIPIRTYGHPSGVHISSLVEIPWGVVEDGRREIVDEGTTEPVEVDEKEIEDELAALGYV